MLGQRCVLGRCKRQSILSPTIRREKQYPMQGRTPGMTPVLIVYHSDYLIPSCRKVRKRYEREKKKNAERGLVNEYITQAFVFIDHCRLNCSELVGLQSNL